MYFRTILFVSVLTLLSVLAHAQKQSALDSSIKHVNLEEVIYHSNALKKQERKTRIKDISLIFQPEHSDHFDSAFFLTNFAAISDRRIKLNQVTGRLDDFDTCNFDICLAVLQFHNGDTLFRTVPIALDLKGREKQLYTLDLSGNGIILESAPFYLGYGFYTKTISSTFRYRLYASSGGKGIYKLIRDGKTYIEVRNDLPNIFPFAITYLDY